MRQDVPQLVISTSPYLKRQVETPAVMRHVIYALLPVVLASIYYFGLSALLVILSCIAGATLSEWLFTGRGSLAESHVADGSALVTAILLALTLPPGIPLWMAFLGAVVAILVGKILFGGLGQNVFNPSLTGRAFLQASFPVALTTWSAQSNLGSFFQIRGDTFALPFVTPTFDAVTAATPLAKMKFEATPTQISDLLFGATPGSIGETCAVLILLGGAYLAYRRFLQWQIPASIFVTVAVFATILHLVNADKYPGPAHHLLSGGLMLGAVFMATDPVTSPVTPRGAWIFGAGIGILVVLIRQFGGLPEGVMYAILLMNGATPLIDRFTQPKIYGAVKPEKKPNEAKGG
jgi:electron transport complex protein RnfD